MTVEQYICRPPRFSVVVPAFRTGRAVQPLLAALAPVLQQLPGTAELLIVDDGSPDDTWAQVQLYGPSAGVPLRAYRLARNYGQRPASWLGVMQAQGAWIFTLDDDLQQPPAALLDLWALSQDQGVPFAVGHLTARHSVPLWRRAISWVAHQGYSWYSGQPPASSFRLFSRELLPQSGPVWPYLNTWLYHAAGGRCAQLRLAQAPPSMGKSRYTPYRRIQRHIRLMWPTLTRPPCRRAIQPLPLVTEIYVRGNEA